MLLTSCLTKRVDLIRIYLKFGLPFFNFFVDFATYFLLSFCFVTFLYCAAAETAVFVEREDVIDLHIWFC